MMQRIRRTSLGLLTSVALIGFAGMASAAEERYEVTSVNSLRPKIVALVVRPNNLLPRPDLFKL